MQPESKVNISYFFITALAVFFTFELHEFCHYGTGEYLGNAMGWTLNSSYPLSGTYVHKNDAVLVSAAGPLFTIVQCFILYFILRKKDNYFLYPFLFCAFFLRFSAMLISFFNLNDEARISRDLGIGNFTLPVLVSLLLFYPVYRISRQYRYSQRLQGFTILFTVFFYSVIILSDQHFHIRIL